MTKAPDLSLDIDGHNLAQTAIKCTNKKSLTIIRNNNERQFGRMKQLTTRDLRPHSQPIDHCVTVVSRLHASLLWYPSSSVYVVCSVSCLFIVIDFIALE